MMTRDTCSQPVLYKLNGLELNEYDAIVDIECNDVACYSLLQVSCLRNLLVKEKIK